jgi:Septum formation initiator
MRTKFRKRRAYGRLVVPLLSLACFAYFGFHAYHGTFGLESASNLEIRLQQLQAELEDVTKRRLELERRVMLMSDGSMEADMLDERARLMLNVARPNEVVYFEYLAN